MKARLGGQLLAAGARFNEAVARLSPSTFVPKGVYRFKSHEEANRQEADWLAQGMALLAAERVQWTSSEPESFSCVPEQRAKRRPI